MDGSAVGAGERHPSSVSTSGDVRWRLGRCPPAVSAPRRPGLFGLHPVE